MKNFVNISRTREYMLGNFSKMGKLCEGTLKDDKALEKKQLLYRKQGT